MCESSLLLLVDLVGDQPPHSSTFEALLRLSPRLCEGHWRRLLEALPIWVTASAISFMLPVPPLGKATSVVVAKDAVSWYIKYVLCFLELGLFMQALEFLLHGIYACIGERWPRVKRSGKMEWLLSVKILPKCPETLLPGVPLFEVRKLFGLYRLIVDYWMASQAIRDDCLNVQVMTFKEFCGLKPAERAYYFLLQTPIDQVKTRLREWAAATSLEHCCLGSQKELQQQQQQQQQQHEEKHTALSTDSKGTSDSDDFVAQHLSQACDLKSEDLLMEALVHLVGRRNQDPKHFALVAEAVEASVPTLPLPERLIISPCVLLKFILDAVYNSDIRYSATDIFRSVDKMYQCIPQPDALVSLDPAEAQHWQALHREADHLEKHLSCTEVFLTRNIRTSMRFADMRASQTNQVLSSFFTSNILSNLAGRYVNAGTWREQLGELFYIHSHALTAEPLGDFVGRLVRILTDLGHYELIPQATEALVDATSQQLVADFLLQLAKEKVNNALPKKGDESLIAAQKILRHVPDGASKQREQKFIAALELVGELLWVQGPHHGPIATLREKISFKASDPADRGFLSTFDIRQLAESNPIALVATLIGFNPEAVHCEDFNRLCDNLGLHDARSPCWPKVATQSAMGCTLTGFNDKAQSLLVPHLDMSVKHEEARMLAVSLGKVAASTLSGGSSDKAYSDCSKLVVSPMRASPAGHLPVLLHTFSEAGTLCPTSETGPSSTLNHTSERFQKAENLHSKPLEGDDNDSGNEACDWRQTVLTPLMHKFVVTSNYLEGNVSAGELHMGEEDPTEQEYSNHDGNANIGPDGWDQFFEVGDEDEELNNMSSLQRIRGSEGEAAGMFPEPSHFSLEEGDKLKAFDVWDMFYGVCPIEINESQKQNDNDKVDSELPCVAGTRGGAEEFLIQDEDHEECIETDWLPCEAAYSELCVFFPSCGGGTVQIAASLLPSQGFRRSGGLQCPASEEGEKEEEPVEAEEEEEEDSVAEALCEELLRLMREVGEILQENDENDTSDSWIP
mmetsp:Transcript_39529/g.84383  ORF Transcript_39529/g.84383 Transcript_39529/m.84383 type:complete len:1023 (+) Transcript_39529:690-3758(+)